ncbi:MAG: FAD-binding oxidoreductase, partial [Deltaproteobacteria bacterium]|nr:FAD-binding oxidoreductase [Deltaproteobacteria bacterium]
MSTNTIPLSKVLNDLEYQEIDDFCNAHQGLEKLPGIAGFLQDKFSLTLVLDPEIIAGYATDSSNLPAHAEALCRPDSERQAAIILRAGRAAKIPITLSGGRSNLTGSATAEGGIVLSTAKLDEPKVVVDQANRQVTSPVNIILEELREKILEETKKALYYPVDPTSRGDAWVGGTIACNASGFTPGEIGATRDWVVGLDILMPDGLKIKAVRGQYVSENGEFILAHNNHKLNWPVPTYPQPKIKNASGPFSSPDGKIDLIDMFIGSEGLFGLVTGCILKLAPRPKEYLDLFFSLSDENRAIAFYQFLDKELDGDFGTLSAFEYFGVNSQSYMDHKERLFYGDNQVAIYLQIPIGEKNLDQETEIWFNRLLASNCNIDPEAIILLDNEPKRRIFMESRHSMP